MNPVDRFQALLRHPDYRRDAKLYIPALKIGLLNFVSEIAQGSVSTERWRQIVKGYTFLRTWGLDHAVDPENTAQVTAVLNALYAGDVSVFKFDLRFQDAIKREGAIDPGHGCVISLYVDLETPMPDLKKLFAAKVNEMRNERVILPKKTKRHKADPWTVWDKMQEPGSNYLKITRSLFGVKGNPSYDEKTKQAYAQVTRAYRKAQALIKEVGASRNETITEKAVAASLTQGIRGLLQKFSELNKT